MADRRPEDLSPPTVPFTPVPDQVSPFADRRTDEHRPLSERINAAYASTPPIVPDPDETDDSTSEQPPEGAADTERRRKQRPTGAERFAAVLAATTARGASPAPTGPEPEPASPTAASASPAEEGADPTAQPATLPPPARPARVRRARLRLTHVDPWSVMKTAFLLAVALGIVLVVAVAVVWTVLGAAGVWSSIDATVGDVLGDTGNFRVEDYLGMSRIMGFTLVVAVVDVVLITVIATLGAFLYNLAAALLGGVEVVLAEEDR